MEVGWCKQDPFLTRGVATLTYVDWVRKSNIDANESKARRRNHHRKTNRVMGMQGIAMGGNNDQPEIGWHRRNTS